MTGIELNEWFDLHNLSQQEAADLLGVSRQTLFRERNKGSEDVSESVSRPALEYSIMLAQNDHAATAERLLAVTNQLLQFHNLKGVGA